MVDVSKPYERTDVEYEPMATDHPHAPVKCKHCGEQVAYHWQTADHRIWCIRNTAETGDAQ